MRPRSRVGSGTRVVTSPAPAETRTYAPMAACDGVLVLSAALPSETLWEGASTVGGVPAAALVTASTQSFYVRLKKFEASETALELRSNVWWFTFVELVG